MTDVVVLGILPHGGRSRRSPALSTRESKNPDPNGNIGFGTY
jgi:hypothetical protein